MRRAIALGGGLLILLLLVFVVRGCLDSREKTALKDYNREVTAIGSESSRQVGQEFFRLLASGGSESPQDLQTGISSFRVQAEQQLKQAQSLNVPDAMVPAQQSLLIALEYRRDGLEYVAERIRTALGDSGDAADEAIEQIAGQMQAFVTSDVLYEARVRPFIKTALDDAEVGGQTIAASRFFPDVAWLEPQTVAAQLDVQLSPGAGRDKGQPTGPGLHGTNVEAVSFGDVTLQPDTANKLTYTPGSQFTVKFTNGGDNDEFEVKATVKIEGGDKPITLTDTINKISPHTSADATMALDTAPPLGTAVTITVQIAAVPGETKTDNNKATYQALFERG